MYLRTYKIKYIVHLINERYNNNMQNVYRKSLIWYILLHIPFYSNYATTNMHNHKIVYFNDTIAPLQPNLSGFKMRCKMCLF